MWTVILPYSTRPEVEWIEEGNTDGVSEEYKKTEGSTRFFSHVEIRTRFWQIHLTYNRTTEGYMKL